MQIGFTIKVHCLLEDKQSSSVGMINGLARKKIKLWMEFQQFLSKSPDAHCHAKSCTASADLCTTVHNVARPARPCMIVLAYARTCLNLARPCKLASAGPDGGSAGHEDLRTTVRLLARPCLTPRVNFRDFAENGNFDNRPRPKVKHCSTLHDRAPMVHDRAKSQNFYKLSFSPHFKGLDFLEQNSLLFRFLKAIQGRLGRS
ncbi:hypothetical protein E3N88_41469 [Mikania micrantha]|uniref:Uncharacterized protein n=1 Tax=Mikania micrantha TaxID=192012 RepID=A0A5N6LQK5_9ASTR|nr:hypothetical protein E3N88_41469 [Mikania micrantha]